MQNKNTQLLTETFLGKCEFPLRTQQPSEEAFQKKNKSMSLTNTTNTLIQHRKENKKLDPL